MRKLLSIIVAAALLVTASPAAYAATSYDVNNVPDMFLNVGITATATTGIDIAAPVRNGETVTYPSTTGSILKIQQGSREELLYYSSATVNNTTKVVTLSGVIRGLCWNTSTAITSCNLGKIFSKGSSVRQVDAAQLLNLKLNLDRANTGTGAFAIKSLQTTRPWLFPNRVTTSQRDAFTAGTGMAEAPIIFNSTTNVMQYWNGSAWINFGSGSTVNASETVRGAVQLGTVKDQSGATVLGTSGAPTVVQTRYLTGSGGLQYRGRVPITGRNGFLSGSLLGTGTRSATTFLHGDQTWSSSIAETDPTIFGYAASGSVTIASTRQITTGILHNFQNFTLNAGATLSVKESNTPLVMRAAGNVTINGTIDLTGSGAAGGAAGTATNVGTAGTAGNSLLSGYTTGAGAGGTYQASTGRSGGGGGSITITGQTGFEASGAAAGGAGGTKMDANQLAFLANFLRGVACGGGGGGGSGTSSGPGGRGSSGGGAMVFYIGGNLTLGASAIIKADGAKGIDGASSAPGGGGGGGGSIVIIVSGTITNAGATFSAAGGLGGAGNGTTTGGAGAAGKLIIYSLTSGTLLTY